MVIYKLKIKVCNIIGVEVLEWFRLYDKIKVLGHVKMVVEEKV